jgi:hypothetical protein
LGFERSRTLQYGGKCRRQDFSCNLAPVPMPPACNSMIRWRTSPLASSAPSMIHRSNSGCSESPSDTATEKHSTTAMARS